MPFWIGTDHRSRCGGDAGQPRVVVGFGIVEGEIGTLHLVADPERPGRLDRRFL
jgi:hypothetical protein